MAGAVRLRGLTEVVRAFNQLDKRAAKEVRDELKKLAEPVAASARQKLARYQGASINTIRPRAGVRGAFVTQYARKVTGLRPDFGALQMRNAFIPALEENEGEILQGVEDFLDRFPRSEGF